MRLIVPRCVDQLLLHFVATVFLRSEDRCFARMVPIGKCQNVVSIPDEAVRKFECVVVIARKEAFALLIADEQYATRLKGLHRILISFMLQSLKAAILVVSEAVVP